MACLEPRAWKETQNDSKRTHLRSDDFSNSLPSKRPFFLDSKKDTITYFPKPDGTRNPELLPQEFLDSLFELEFKSNPNIIPDVKYPTKYCDLALEYYQQKTGKMYKFTKLRQNAPLKLREQGKSSHVNFFAQQEGDVFFTMFYAEIQHFPEDQVLQCCPLDLTTASIQDLTQFMIHPPEVQCEFCSAPFDASIPGYPWYFAYSSDEFED